MAIDTPTITSIKRKRGAPLGNANALHHGAPRGNSNAVKHGLYAAIDPHPHAAPLQSDRGALVSGQLSVSKHLDSRAFFLQNLRMLDQIDGIVFTLVPRMFAAPSQEAKLVWLRPILKLIRAKQKVMRAMFLGSYHDRVLFTLSRDSIRLAYQEFADRGLREFPITLPSDFNQFCADPSSTSYTFSDNTVIPPSAPDLFVLNFFKKSRRYDISVLIPSPFLTDQQWLRIENSFLLFQEKMDSTRRRKRKKKDFPARLLFEAMFIKLAYGLPWKKLPRIIKTIHPDILSFPRWKCQSLYRDLYNSGFLQSVYKQLYSHLHDFGGTSIKKLVSQGCFQISNKSVFLAPGQPLPWQNFTALLLLQSAYSNYRAKRHLR
jgi:hypothetical protein